MKDLPVYTLMAMYAIPALSLLFIDALDGFSRIKQQPGGAMFIFGICAFVQLWGALIIYLDNKKETKWRANIPKHSESGEQPGS